MTTIGPLDFAAVVLIGLLVVGPRRFSAVGRRVGQNLRNFEDALRSGDPTDIDRARVGLPRSERVDRGERWGK